jgi:D-arginine dehydrogenase
MTPSETDILIVGAGMAGASTAFHLTRRSDRRVVILEKEATPGVHSSGRNAAFIREYAGDDLVQPVTTAGAEFLRRGELAEYRPCGSVLLGLGNDDVSRHFPPARGRGRWCPLDGTIDAAGLLAAYLRGLDVRLNTEVLGREPRGGRIAVHTDRGPFLCEILVNAAGPWAGRLGNLPLTPLKRHLYVTRPMPHIDPSWPFVWDVRHGLYFRPESGGLLLGPCDESPSEPGDYTEDPAVLEDLHRKLSTLQPALAEVSIQNSWAGQRTFALDRHFVIGFDPRQPGLFHVAGLGGHGVTASHEIGRVAADLILGRTVKGAEAFAPDRLLHPAAGGP